MSLVKITVVRYHFGTFHTAQFGSSHSVMWSVENVDKRLICQHKATEEMFFHLMRYLLLIHVNVSVENALFSLSGSCSQHRLSVCAQGLCVWEPQLVFPTKGYREQVLNFHKTKWASKHRDKEQFVPAVWKSDGLNAFVTVYKTEYD